MAIKEFTFKVDFITKNSLCVADVNQEDNAMFNIYLTEQGKAIDLTGQQVRIFVRKPDGKIVVQETDIEIKDAKGGYIQVNAHNSMFQAVGVAVGQIDLWGSDKNNTSSGTFIMEVGEHLGGNETVKSYVDVELFRELTGYIDEANADISKYKTLMESFVEAGVSLQGLVDIKEYIDKNLAGLKSETDEAVSLIPKVDNARKEAESKRVEVVGVTNSAEAKRKEVVKTTTEADQKMLELRSTISTSNTSKTNLESATANADKKKKEVEGATASAEAKRVQVVNATNTGNNTKSALQSATASADKKKKEVEGATASAEAKRVQVVGATNTANASKSALDKSINSGNSVKAGLDKSINSGNSLKAGLDTSITAGNNTKKALDSATASASSMKGQVESATANANTKKGEVVAVTNSAEAKRKELDVLLTQINTEGILAKGVIPTSRDCNDFKELNKWIAWDTGNGDFKNTPEGYLAKGTSKVFVLTNRGFATTRVQQECIYIYPKTRVTKWVRNYQESGWGAWYKTYDEANKPTPQDIGAVNKNGDTVNGDLNINGRVITHGDGNSLNMGTSVYDVAIGNGKSKAWLQLKNDGTLQYNNQKIYYEGHKPKPSEIGAYPIPKTGITDFNTALTEGQYLIAGELPNAPLTGIKYGILLVYVSCYASHNNQNNWIWQEYFDTSGNNYWRYKVNNGGWSSWKENYNSSNKPTPAEIGALGKTEKAYDSDRLFGMGMYKDSSSAGIPTIGGDGVMEVGKYIDFHANKGTDFDARLEITSNGEANFHTPTLRVNGASVTTDLDFPKYPNSSGYQKLPSGLILQWGLVSKNLSAGQDGQYFLDVAFPIVFPHASLCVVATPLANKWDNGKIKWFCQSEEYNYYSNNNKYATFRVGVESGGGATTVNLKWIAIGY